MQPSLYHLSFYMGLKTRPLQTILSHMLINISIIKTFQRQPSLLDYFTDSLAEDPNHGFVLVSPAK